MNTMATQTEKGATARDIQFHYDLGREFYQVWLDESMTYSCAKFEPGDDLHTAQLRKLDFHIKQAEISANAHVLDIGCGWGSLIRRIIDTVENPRCLGLTLSQDQKSKVEETDHDNVEAQLRSWETLTDENAFDAVVSIGAFEHFARPEMSTEEKIQLYRGFFKKIRQVLKPGHCLSLQTIVFDKMPTQSFPTWITDEIFPGSILPRLHEILAAADGVLSLENLRNDGFDYGLTCREWVKRIEAARDEVVSLVGEERTHNYGRYLRMSSVAFEQKQFGLLRLKFRAHS